jgi:hypothetical protein
MSLENSQTLEIPKGAVEFTFDSKAQISEDFLRKQKEISKYWPCPTIEQLEERETTENDPFER